MFKIKRKKQNEYSVFNLEISRAKTSLMPRKRDNTAQYIGEFIVQNSGRLKHGRDKTLHTYKATLEYCDDHIHFSKGGITDILTQSLEPFIKRNFKISRFTLDGLYSTFRISESEKQESLINYIQKLNPDFQFNSIATHEATRIKLLENAYKQNISNQ